MIYLHDGPHNNSCSYFVIHIWVTKKTLIYCAFKSVGISIVVNVKRYEFKRVEICFFFFFRVGKDYERW